MNDVMQVVRRGQGNGLCDSPLPQARSLEKVYETALAHRLRKSGLDVKQQYALHVLDDDLGGQGEYDDFVLSTRYGSVIACRILP